MEETNEKEMIRESMGLLEEVKKQMELPKRWIEADAYYVFKEVSKERRAFKSIYKNNPKNITKMNKIINTEPQEKKNNKPIDTKKEDTKKKLEYKHKYKFSQKPGHATNSQLSFIQELKEKAEEELLKIDVDVENVPVMVFQDANIEIRRLKDKLGWKDKSKDDGASTTTV